MFWLVDDERNTQTTNQKCETDEDKLKEKECCFAYLFFFPVNDWRLPLGQNDLYLIVLKNQKETKKTYIGIMQIAQG